MKFGVIEADGGSSVVVIRPSGDAVAVPGYRDVGALLDDPRRHEVVAEALISGDPVPLDGAQWLPPVRRPGKILCVALNNSANPDRIMSGPDHPAMFFKPASALTGHGRPIRLRATDGRVHPEPELAVVIGTGGADIPEDDALRHVFGYTIIDDITAPAMRAEDTFHYRAIHPDPDDPAGVRYTDTWVSYPARYKGADTFAPTGPWVVTADEIPDPHVLRVQCRHEGRLITDDTTANLRFSVAEVISFASQYFTLEPGDIIAMGTALRRSAAGGAIQNLDLTALGGTVEIEIDGIGTLANPVDVR